MSSERTIGLNNPYTVSVLAILTASLLVMMFVISLITGVNQQFIEVVQPWSDYEKALRDGEGILRIILTIDGFFIASYWLLGIFLVITLWHDQNRFLLSLSVACISITAVLDIVENSEFLMYMESLNKGLSLLPTSVQSLMVFSSVKWYMAYFAFLFLGFATPDSSTAEKSLAFIMKYVQLPIGILVFTLPTSPALLVAHLSRFAVLLVILGLIAKSANLWRHRKNVG